MDHFTGSPPIWKSVKAVPDLEGDQVVVWRFDPGSQRTRVNEFESMLSQEERLRLDRFTNRESRCNFIVCRGVLHFLLARAENTGADQLKIQNGLLGKPELVSDAHSSPVYFNISHTEGLCLIALSRHFEVGVDVEMIRSIKELPVMARSYLSPDEYALWMTGDDTKKTIYFHDCWCAKEAVLKAAGCGLAIHPSQIDTLEAISGRPVRGIQEDGCMFEFRDCRLVRLPLDDDCIGWLAVMGKLETIELYDLADLTADKYR